LTLKYGKLQEKQKGLQRNLNGKISNDIHNVQQILEAMARQSQKTDRLNNNNNNNNLEKTDREEAINDMISLDTEENTSIANYKMKAYWYPSLLMYNSY
jgi:hypothetical protein